MKPRLGLGAALAASLLGATLLAAPTSALAADRLNIWYVNPLPNTPDWGRSGKLFQEAAEANGYKATLVGPTKIDIPAMISQIEQAITDGADGIITCPLDPTAFKATTRAQWEAAAEAWHRWGPTIEDWLGAATERMLDDVRLAPGSRVLQAGLALGVLESAVASLHVGPLRLGAGYRDIVPLLLVVAVMAVRRQGSEEARP